MLRSLADGFEQFEKETNKFRDIFETIKIKILLQIIKISLYMKYDVTSTKLKK